MGLSDTAPREGRTETEMICRKCGKTLDDNVRSCPYCGQKTGEQVFKSGMGEIASSQSDPVDKDNHSEQQVFEGNAQTGSSGEGTGGPENAEREPEENGKKENESPKGKTKKIRVIAVAAAVLAVLLLLSMCGRSSNPPEDAEADSTAVTEPGEPEGIEPEDIEPEETESSQEAEEELLMYMNQAEEQISRMYSELDAIDESDSEGIEKIRRRAEILEAVLPDVEKLQEQANEISSVDAALKEAVREYFVMNHDVFKGYHEIQVFMRDYLDFCEKSIYTRPDPEDAASAYDYYYALNEWYPSAKEAYEAIDSCPLCLEAEWERYGKVLDLNDDILKKTALANNYKDGLRWQSVKNMSARYETSEELGYQAFLDCLGGEMTHVRRQRSISSSLAEEIHAYAELGEKERDGYEFENNRSGKIFIGDDAFEAVDTIYPSLYHTYDAFLIIKTGCVSGTRKIVVEAEIPGFTQKYKESFTLDATYREIAVKPPALTGELDLASAKDAQLTLTISEQENGAELISKSFPLTIKSKYDFDWISEEYGVMTKDNILCFLTPESSAISEMKRQAIDEISSMTDGQMESFVGYQNTRWNNHYVGTYLQAAGIMRALNEMGVRYNMKTFSLSSSNQHILLPDDVLEQKGGLCIETSLVVASALQSAGMHAFIVLPPGHAQVAVEVWDGRGEDTKGTGEYFLIETTALDQDWSGAFIDGANGLLNNQGPTAGPITYKNRESWEEYLSVENTYLIDCNDSRVLGLTPFVN